MNYLSPRSGSISSIVSCIRIFYCRQLSDFIRKAAPNLFFESCFLILSVLCQLFLFPPNKAPPEYPCPDPHNRSYNEPRRSDRSPSTYTTAFFRPVSDRRDFPDLIQQDRPHSTPDVYKRQLCPFIFSSDFIFLCGASIGPPMIFSNSFPVSYTHLAVLSSTIETSPSKNASSGVTI